MRVNLFAFEKVYPHVAVVPVEYFGRGSGKVWEYAILLSVVVDKCFLVYTVFEYQPASALRNSSSVSTGVVTVLWFTC